MVARIASLLSSAAVLFTTASLPYAHAWEGDLPYGNDLGYYECSDEQITHIALALGEVNELALSGLSLAMNDNRANINAFKHYFRSGDKDGDPADYKMFQAAMTAMIPWILPKDGIRVIPWKIECVPKSNSNCGRGDRAITEAGPNVEDPTMFICPAFFTSTDTKRSIRDEKICGKGRQSVFADFETGAHTLMHEITHFDGFGVTATFPEYKAPDEDEPAHGTIDWRKLTSQRAARDLTGNPSNGVAPWRNAENHAAAATEFYFQNKCALDNIPLNLNEIDACPSGCMCIDGAEACSRVMRT